ncbi:hypothetical protein [Phytoactinopolyspora limicola]|uniref:hypothetical protein n=1 Tax=Phytoactinopolyspora limicola TaxID=2715536 RepID=UPI00140918F0|nr:hypothetical protein [Phytoactinopolyspora limicola]
MHPTTLPTLSLERAVALTEEVIAGKEDFVYRSPNCRIECVYIHRGAPSCLVGLILVAHGIPINVVVRRNGQAIGNRLDLPADAIDGWAKIFLCHLQTWQDRGEPWGQAFSLAAVDTQRQIGDRHPWPELAGA